MLFGIFFLLAILSLLLIAFLAYRAGGYKKQLTRKEAIDAAVKKAVQKRDRLNFDDNYLKRLRNRFTRR